ncbi:general substrate transporter [Rhizodiscina lignyota]|uniref:General substrate transporter n=1 Tax=Rhizodiscina lignyota TaxID=1504668 RepID=A0A9P4M3X0_9PEZI|nr:general substrate transporter [Rhizodiscina lignyota]
MDRKVLTSVESISSEHDVNNDNDGKEIDQRSGHEARESWRRDLKANPRALMWSTAFQIVLAIPRFRQDYGNRFQGQFVVSAGWQLAFQGGSLVGFICGVFTIFGVLLQWLSGGSPANLIMFTAGKLLTGIPLGIFITIAPTYCAEVAPMTLRGAVTAAVNWSIVFGQFLAYIVMRQTQSLPGANAYRILFGVQWFFAALALVVLPFFPESPYHLLAQGRVTKAKRNIWRLYGSEVDAEQRMAEIMKNVAVENDIKSKSSFAECFRGRNRQRTLIAMSTFLVQAMCGISWIVGTSTALDASVALSGLMLIGNMFGWIFIERFGRRGTGLWGAIVLTGALLMIGVTSTITTPGAIWAQVAFMAVWAFMYQATIGSVAWPIVTEVSRSSLRGHTQSLATVVNGLAGAISGVALPFLMNPDQANLKGRIAFIYGGFLGLASVYIWWKWPETKGLRFAEIDELFETGVAPRS